MAGDCHNTTASIFCAAHWEWWNKTHERKCLHPVVLSDDWEIAQSLPGFFNSHAPAQPGQVNLVCASCGRHFGTCPTTDAAVPKRRSTFSQGLGLKKEGEAA
jgi:hypothetical protein